MRWEERNRLILANLKTGSHYSRVYLYLRDNGTLTVQESISIWNRYNLAQVVQRLKKYGANIIDLHVGANDGRYKSKRLKPWARYQLLKEDDDEPIPSDDIPNEAKKVTEECEIYHTLNKEKKQCRN
jgi:hypothetical protein